MAKTEKRHPYGRKFGAGVKNDRKGGHLGQDNEYLPQEVIVSHNAKPLSLDDGLRILSGDGQTTQPQPQQPDKPTEGFTEFVAAFEKGKGEISRKEGRRITYWLSVIRGTLIQVGNFLCMKDFVGLDGKLLTLRQIVNNLRNEIATLRTQAPAATPAATDPKLREDLDAKPSKGAVAEAIRDAVTPLGERVTALEVSTNDPVTGLTALHNKVAAMDKDLCDGGTLQASLVMDAQNAAKEVVQHEAEKAKESWTTTDWMLVAVLGMLILLSISSLFA